MVADHRGPDRLLPADSHVSIKRDKPVKLHMSASGLGSEPPISVPSALIETVHRAPNHVAMAVKREGEWVKWTYRQYLDDVQTAAKAFIRLGLQPFHSVGIIGFNSPEWFISSLAAIFAGGFSTGIYTTNSPEAVQYVAANSQANILVVENDVQLQKVLHVRESLPDLCAIIQYTGEISGTYPDVYTWSDFMKKSHEIMDGELEDRLRMQAPNRCCTLIYTSGTTGNPKGVMLSHDNVTWTARSMIRTLGMKFGDELRSVSYLPLSHIAGQLSDIHFAYMVCGTVYFAQPDALKGSLLATLQEVRPSGFVGVPRVWEKFQEGIQTRGRDASGFRRKVAAWARGLGLQRYQAASNGRDVQPMGWGLADKLVFQKVKGALGLDLCRYFMSSAAPLSRETLEFFGSLNIPIMEVYGMSESSGPQTTNLSWAYTTGSVGKSLNGTVTRIHQPDKDGHGEVCMSGRNVFMGYLNMEEKTREALGGDGELLHSGDIGTVDKLGFLHITGRIKELLITAGGENVAPVPIEDRLKAELPCVSNCMLIGDKKKFLSILITLKVDVDSNTMEPKDTLTPLALDWCREQGSDVTTVSDVLRSRDPQIWKAIQAGVDRTNERSVSRAQKIQKWTVLPKDFSIPGGELGPTLKLKRGVVAGMYEDIINAFYSQ